MAIEKRKFEIFFLATDVRNQSEIPRKLIQTAHAVCKEKFSKPVMIPMFEVQYYEFRTKVMRKFRLIDDMHDVMVFCINKYMLMSELFDVLKTHCPVTMLELERDPMQWYQHLSNPALVMPQRDYVYFSIQIDGRIAGNLIIEIFTNINPALSKSFMELFSKDTVSIGCYHVFTEGWLEFGIGGKFMPARGDNHHKLMSHNRRGIFSFSQDFNYNCDAFFIHFTPCTFFDDKRTVLGRVVHGDELLQKIESLESEFGRIEDTDFKINGLGIVPIGKNADNSTQVWMDCINQMFGLEKSTVVRKINEPKRKLMKEEIEQDQSHIVCPLFQKQSFVEIDGEEQSIPSGYSTPETIVPQNINKNIENLTLHYEQYGHELQPEYSLSRLKIQEIMEYSELSMSNGESPRSINDVDCTYDREPSIPDCQKNYQQCPSIDSCMD